MKKTRKIQGGNKMNKQKRFFIKIGMAFSIATILTCSTSFASSNVLEKVEYNCIFWKFWKTFGSMIKLFDEYIFEICSSSIVKLLPNVLK